MSLSDSGGSEASVAAIALVSESFNSTPTYFIKTSTPTLQSSRAQSSPMNPSTSLGRSSPKNKGGRKRTVSQPSKNLKSQREFQIRRMTHIKDLEQENKVLKAAIASTNSPSTTQSNETAALIKSLQTKVLALEAENTMMKENLVAVDLRASVPSNGSTACPGCALERMRSVTAYGLLRQQEEKVAGLVLECQSLRSVLALNQFLASIDVVSAGGETGSESGGSIGNLADVSGLEIDNVILSAEDLYGPMEVEFARVACKALPSLADCVYVDRLFDTFLIQSKSRDKGEIRKLNFRTMYLRGKLLDACSVLDRHKVIETIVLFLHRNRNHILHRDSTFPPDSPIRPWTTSPLTVPMPAEALRFRDSLYTVVPFQRPENKQLIDEFLSVFWTPTSQRRGKEKLHRIMVLGKQLEKLCVELDDMYKINMLIEVIREGNRALWDGLFDGVDLDS
ncbi:hypothetical protein BCR33DRAFT_718845 [Rhizoclosmatium globosum]|uniref:BZIP domain-containing protein n=1 Tax=Rhizoclosmatium globosum TaxID=329046 RepID=A0A1Y2C605_9FUNG|nr:hypothetical protein BCR33DRAFT_718845 [Rhizoclosmatium globosum]|eukprot:ORY41725.1 hypothetical protein BCR33DRAFT_718845 [Rhizoclosmatium globosum]